MEENVKKERTRRPYKKVKKEVSKEVKKTNKRIGKRNNKRDENKIFKKEKIKIIPLGGILEIGKNLTVFESEDDIVIVDCGLGFP